MLSGLLVRALREDDLDRAASLTAQLGYAASVEQLRARLACILGRPEHALFAADRAGSVAGWLHAQAQHRFESDPFVEITGLVVADDTRRSGVGRVLVGAVETWARALGYTHLQVRSDIRRPESHAFYRALGFSLKKTQHNYALNLCE